VILGLLFAVSIVTYIDRVNISVTARQMMPALDLTNQQMGFVFSSFVIGYALFQIPGGWLADRWGARLVLTAGLLWWSGFTAFTAIAATSWLASLLGILGALILVRFLLGIGEAVALPTFNRAVTDWLPVYERGMGIGLAIGGIGIGSAITPPLTAWIMVNYGWQTAFYLSAVLGIGLAVVWWSMARDHPNDHLPEDKKPTHSGALAAQPVRIPWKSWRHTPSVRWLVLSYTCLGYVAYIYLSWFYLYLVDVRGFTVLQSGLYAAAPFLAILVFCPLGGWVTDRLAVRQGLARGRRLVGLTGMVLAAVFIGGGGTIDSPYWAIAALSIGAGWLYFSVGAYWASTSDLSKTHAGSLSGLMNMGANLGGAISPTLTPWIAEQGGWPLSLSIAALIAFAGGLMWLWINPARGLEQDTPGNCSLSLRS
jgi:ACS family glucarate transporter-like MFS transporter